MVRAYQMADRKELDLDERITLTRAVDYFDRR